VGQGPYQHNFSAVPEGLFSGCESSRGATETLLVDSLLQYSSWDLINAGGLATISFSIDEHPMYVYAVDGRYIVPELADVVKLVPGRRFSVLVKLDKPPGDYTIRSTIVGNQILNTTATMSYNAAIGLRNAPSTPYIDITGRNATPDAVLLDETQIIPFPVEVPAHTADRTFVLNIDRFNSSYQWSIGNSSFPLALEEAAPLLFFPDSEVAHSDLAIRTTNGSWVDLIFYVRAAPQPEHPIHKHSNKFFYIGSGQGEWNYSSVEEAMRHVPQNFNLHSPPRFDTLATPAAMSGPVWTAVRYHVVNPGAFVIHCHIQVHTNGGMSLAVLDGIDAWPQIPEEYQLCPTDS
jgi:FtsP/CotA-like multicopper oxidase with cupredoxin domain